MLYVSRAYPVAMNRVVICIICNLLVSYMMGDQMVFAYSRMGPVTVELVFKRIFLVYPGELW